MKLVAAKLENPVWLRSPNTNNSNNVYYVSSSGSSTNNNANNQYGFSLDRIIESYPTESKRKAETVERCKELQCLPRVKHRVNSRRRRRLPLVSPHISSDIFSFENLFNSIRECVKGVSWKNSVIRWKLNTVSYCNKLYEELHNHTYKLSPYVVLEIFSPKHRTIKSLKFRDRVVQRTLCNYSLYRDLTKGNIYDNAACQKHKGTLFALDRLKVLLGRYHRKYGNNGWVLKLDIHKFFDSIPHDKLCQMIDKKAYHPIIRDMVKDVINSFPDPGIGLGSQLSQLMAVSYLSDLDHYIKEQFHIKCYIRYSDDLIIIHQDREYLLKCKAVIENRLKALGLALNTDSSFYSLKNGVTFLKFHYIIKSTGRIICTPTRSLLVRARRRYYRMLKNHISYEEIKTSFRSWASFVLQGSNRRKVVDLWKSILQKNMLQKK